MKKFIIAMLAMCFAVAGANAQTDTERQASDQRIGKLKQLERPKECGIGEIDGVVAKCAAISEMTIRNTETINSVQNMLDGEITEELIATVKALQGDIGKAANELAETGKLLSGATQALKSIKNPMKLKGASKAVNYAQEIIGLSSEELSAYQTKAIAGIAEKVFGSKAK